MLTGIQNVNNNCYASAIIQCLRSVGIYVDIDMKRLGGQSEDAFEFYMYLMGQIPYQIQRKFHITTIRGDNSYYLLLDDRLNLVGDKISSFGDILCVHTLTKMRPISDLARLVITMQQEEYIFSLISCVCYDFDRLHYYAIVKEQNRWYICDDSRIESMYSGEHNINLLFYKRQVY